MYKEVDKLGRRILSLTGKEYRPLFEDMRNIDKKVLKEDRDNFERDNKYLNEQLSMETAHCEQLSNQNTELVLSNAELTLRVQKLEEELATIKKRVSDLENVFYKKWCYSRQVGKAYPAICLKITSVFRQRFLFGKMLWLPILFQFLIDKHIHIGVFVKPTVSKGIPTIFVGVVDISTLF